MLTIKQKELQQQIKKHVDAFIKLKNTNGIDCEQLAVELPFADKSIEVKLYKSVIGNTVKNMYKNEMQYAIKRVIQNANNKKKIKIIKCSNVLFGGLQGEDDNVYVLEAGCADRGWLPFGSVASSDMAMQGCQASNHRGALRHVCSGSRHASRVHTGWGTYTVSQG